MKGIDYSWARPGGAAISAAGFEFVMRYVPYPGDGGKGLTNAEVTDLFGHNLPIGLVFEFTAGRMFDGYPAGREDAVLCIAAGLRLHWPTDRPFYFACDVDTVPAQLALVDDYLRGAASILGLAHTGIYGEYDVIEHCVGSTATWGWQTYAWSGGKVSSKANVYQYLNGQVLNGGSVDYNKSLTADFGQHPTPESTPMTDDEVYAIFGSTENLPDGSPDWPARHANARDRLTRTISGELNPVREYATTPVPTEPHIHDLTGSTGGITTR